ncbi:DNA helicase IV [Antricoccus suffuscus]|uniref:DNA helicase IV n=1 Tax=Antricoccus suffuscus TaxID=1629062 RepID=A0A2T0ZWL5_9ACTN|nr:AAA family ATPase [Antricoccus suffuscus]PRZ40755.1 DNA helicase IV [Antricoccus suffuscus]
MSNSPRTTANAFRQEDSALHQEVTREQNTLDRLFARREILLDEVRSQLQQAGIDDSPEAAARITGLVRRRTELDRADSGLCFGRIEELNGVRLHIGRVGLPGEDDSADPLLVDWRAPIARKFYTATAARPQGLRSRRHIRTEGRAVLGVDDEAFDRHDRGGDLVGEAALLEALDARRTGAMGDVVATLQSEQDEVIRAPHGGCLVVQGGPGTGKTAVALHRAAYLLFTYPQLAERGVLVVGPSPTFLRYIEQVLPSLGETQVVASTVDRLLPGVDAKWSDDAQVAKIKGRAVWAVILRRVVEARSPVLTTVEVHHGEDLVSLDQEQVAEALAAARAAGTSHYDARAAFRLRMIDLLTRQVVEHSKQMLSTVEAGFEDVLSRVDAAMARGNDALPSRVDSDGVDVDGVATAADISALRQDLAHSGEVSAALDQLWPVLEPTRVLAELLSSPALLAEYAPELTPDQRSAIQKENTSDWSEQDVALLDEVADLVGTPSAVDTVGDSETLSDRAMADRTWTYGHVVVDEAQELSAMQWRMLVRRCPTRSFTVVGDVNQTESPGGSASWDTALEPSFGRRFRRGELTICYRTPHEIMERTGPVLAAAGSTVAPPRAVRSNGVQPWRRFVSEVSLRADTIGAVREMADRYRGGQIAVIGADSTCSQLRDFPEDVDAEVAILTPAESKGLEFDAVLIVEPHAVIAQRRGWNALYVAMTRCTQELGVLSSRPGPDELSWS